MAMSAHDGVAVTCSAVAPFVVTWASEGWLYTPKGPAFAAADRAYEATWGHKLLQVGVGGSIPFVALFGRRFGDLPLILNGVMDPQTTAHGPSANDRQTTADGPSATPNCTASNRQLTADVRCRWRGRGWCKATPDHG